MPSGAGRFPKVVFWVEVCMLEECVVVVGSACSSSSPDYCSDRFTVVLSSVDRSPGGSIRSFPGSKKMAVDINGVAALKLAC